MTELLSLDGLRLESEAYDRNSHMTVGRVGGGYEPCFLCGRYMTHKGLLTGWQICVVAGGSDLCRADAHWDTDDPGYMGWFGVGPECAKKIPAAFKSKEERTVL